MPAIYRIPTGIDGLDVMLGGGAAFPSTLLVAGAAGTGKTTLGLQFLMEGARREESGIYFTTLSEDVQWTLYFTSAYKFMKKESFEEHITFVNLGKFIKTSGFDYQSFKKEIEDHIKEKLPQRVVIDPITVFPVKDDFRMFLYDMSISMKNWNCTTVLTGEVSPEELYPVAVSYVVDGVILLTTALTKEKVRNRYIEVLKMRGTKHITGKHLMHITENGIEVSVGMV